MILRKIILNMQLTGNFFSLRNIGSYIGHKTGPAETSKPVLKTSDQERQMSQYLTNTAPREMEFFFNPESIAIVGASADPTKLGGRPLAALLKKGFSGNIYPINPRYERIGKLRCYRSVTNVPGDIDLAVISVPREALIPVLQECAEKKVKAAVIFTAGFAETGDEGMAVQNKITELSRRSGIRILGPNCIGFIHFGNAVMASFSDVMEFEAPSAGSGSNLAFITQSGAYGERTFMKAFEEEIGVSAFVSVGNEADLEFSDFLNYLVDDEDTGLMGVYLEGAKNGNKFRRAAEAALRAGKPVLVKKVGRTSAGKRAAESHTGSLSGTDKLYDAFFRQVGIIRYDELRDLVNFAKVFQAGRIPLGRNVAILTDSGGPGVEMADKCEEFGLNVPELSDNTRSRIAKVLPFYGSARNPVDMTAAVMTDQRIYGECLRAIMDDNNVHIVFAPGFFMNYTIPSLLDEILDIYRSSTKPLIMFPLWQDRSPHAREMIDKVKAEGIPLIDQATDAALAVASLTRYGEIRRRFLKINDITPHQ